MYTPDSFDSGDRQPAIQQNRQKANGQIRQREDDVNIIVNKTKTKPKISPDSSVGSMDSRAQSECGSIRSSDKEIYPGPIQQGHAIVSAEIVIFRNFFFFHANSNGFLFHSLIITILINSIVVTLRVQIVMTVVIKK